MNYQEIIPDRYGISSRYLQKLFLQYTGLTPGGYAGEISPSPAH